MKWRCGPKIFFGIAVVAKEIYVVCTMMMMMMMTPGKFKVLKQPILSIGFFRFVIMDDDELNSLGAYREE